MNLRRFVSRATGLGELVTLGTLTAHAGHFLQAAVASGLNILVAGGIPAGKTTVPAGVAEASALRNVLYDHRRDACGHDAQDVGGSPEAFRHRLFQQDASRIDAIGMQHRSATETRRIRATHSGAWQHRFRCRCVRRRTPANVSE